MNKNKLLIVTKLFIKEHWFGVLVFLIIIFSGFLRFYNYENRWGLAYDQAHDALVARYALEAHKIPLLGPFSSGAPIQTGGEWYWFIMAATAVYPNAVMTPWIVLTLFYIIFVFLIILVGKKLVDEKFGLLVGLLSSVSTAQIAQSANLTLTAPMAIITLGVLWSMINYVRKIRTKDLFLLGFFIGLAPAFHLSGTPLFLVLIVTILLVGFPSKRSMAFLLLGLLLPLLPNIFFDLQNNLVNSRNLLQYILHDQYNISLDVLGRRWLTYALVFWPNVWAHVIGGEPLVGYLLTGGLFLTAIYNYFKKRINKEWYIILLSFIIIIIVIRYLRTPLFYSYIVFLHPFIFFLTGWIVYSLFKRSSIVGILMLFIILGGSFGKSIAEINNSHNYSDLQARNLEKTLMAKFPNKKFALYDYKYMTVEKSLPLVLYLSADNKISDDGIRVGMMTATESGQFQYPVIIGQSTGDQVVDLAGITSKEVNKKAWVSVNPSAIYHSTQEWYGNKKK
ncbi:glycosyltransferase family 39 protein [Patescibacteria group bacterium]|nr:glycosyltransferase family 39 protein [Patescibacteria group bacterium]